MLRGIFIKIYIYIYIYIHLYMHSYIIPSPWGCGSDRYKYMFLLSTWVCGLYMQCYFMYIEFRIYGRFLRVSEANEVPISSHIRVASTIFKQLLNLWKKSEKYLKNIITILGVAESFETMNRPDPNWPDRNALWQLFYRKV